MADGRRAVAERNTEAIIAAALDVLGRHAGAGIAEVASAAGVGRATVYRHFPSREALLDVLRVRMERRLREVSDAAAAAAAVDFRMGMLVLVDGLGEISDRFAALRPSDDEALERAADKVYAPVVALVRRAQEDGRLDPGLDADWFISALRGLLTAARRERQAGRLTRAETAPLVVTTLLDGVFGRALHPA